MNWHNKWSVLYLLCCRVRLGVNDKITVLSLWPMLVSGDASALDLLPLRQGHNWVLRFWGSTLQARIYRVNSGFIRGRFLLRIQSLLHGLLSELLFLPFLELFELWNICSVRSLSISANLNSCECDLLRRRLPDSTMNLFIQPPKRDSRHEILLSYSGSRPSLMAFCLFCCLCLSLSSFNWWKNIKFHYDVPLMVM